MVGQAGAEGGHIGATGRGAGVRGAAWAPNNIIYLPTSPECRCPGLVGTREMIYHMWGSAHFAPVSWKEILDNRGEMW